MKEITGINLIYEFILRFNKEIICQRTRIHCLVTGAQTAAVPFMLIKHNLEAVHKNVTTL